MADRKKVAVLNPYVSTRGGGEKHMGYLCQFIEQYYNYNVDIDILVSDNEAFDVYADDFVTIQDLNNQFGLELTNTSIRILKLPKMVDRKSYLKSKSMLEKTTKEYDVFINFMFLSKHVGKAKKNIYEVMFPPLRYRWELNKNIFYKLVGTFLDWIYYRSYDVYISNSQFTNKWQNEYWRDNRNHRYVYPPVFSEKDIENRYDEEKKENIIVSVGRFFVSAHSKKQLEMVRFFVNHQELFKDYEYHLCGAVSDDPDDQHYLSKVQKEADKVDNVFIHLFCAHDKLMELYSKAKIFWHATGYQVNEDKEPEKMEHFGITTVEAMSYGAVPEVINKGGQKETVCEGVNGFRWDTEEDCVGKTKMLIENDALRKQFALRSVDFAKNYSIEKFNEANRRIFDEYKI